MFSSKRHRLLIGWFVAALCGAGEAPAQQEKPLSADEVITMIRSGLDQREVIADLRQRKIYGPLSADDERRLLAASQAAGGDSAVLAEARNPANVAAVIPRPAASPGPIPGSSAEDARRAAAARVMQQEREKFEAELRWRASLEETREQAGESYLEEVERRNSRTRANVGRPPSFADYRGDDEETQKRKGTCVSPEKPLKAIRLAEVEARCKRMEGTVARLKENIRRFQELARTDDQRQSARPYIEDWQLQIRGLQAELGPLYYEAAQLRVSSPVQPVGAR